MPNQFDCTSLNRTVGWAWDGAIEGFQAVKFHRKSKARSHFRELDRFFLAPKKVLLYHSPTVLALGSAKRSSAHWHVCLPGWLQKVLPPTFVSDLVKVVRSRWPALAVGRLLRRSASVGQYTLNMMFPSLGCSLRTSSFPVLSYTSPYHQTLIEISTIGGFEWL